MALQLRRGTNKERLQITPVEGELIFVTDWELAQITGTSIDGTTETITFSAAHGLSVGDQLLFQSSTQLGLTQSTVYYVISAGLTTTACRLSTSSGGAAVDLTTGSGLTLLFAKTPTNAAGTPVGTNVTALWIGDGTTVGGIAGNTQGLDDLTDVEITTPTEGNTFYYDATTSLWKNTNIVTIDDVNLRVGINDTTPSTTLDITGTLNVTTSATIGTIRIDNTNNEIDTTSGNLTLDSTGGTVLVDDNLNVDSGVLYVDAANNRVGVNNSTPNFALDVTGNSYINGDLTLTGDIQVGGNDIKASDGSTNITLTSNTLTTFAGDIKVTGNDIQASDGNTNITMTSNTLTTFAGDIKISGNDIQSSSGSTAITLSGTNVTIAGDLTVNGTTTTVNSTTLTVDDKNIELASTASPSDATADGGGITLKGTTDKKIYWDNATDRWYVDNGDGNNYLIPYQLDDLNDVVISTATKGDLLYYNGTNWANEPLIQFDSTAQRTRFQFNTTAAGVRAGAVMIKNTGGIAYTDGDGSGILVAVDSDSQASNIFAGLSAVYNSVGNHEVRLRTSTDSFASIEKNILTVNDDDLKVKATEFVLNALGTGSAGVDAQITVERGTTGTDSYFKWDETNDFWVASNGLKSEGNITADADIIANGNLTLNNDGGANNVTITFKDSPGPTSKTITWHDANNQFEISEQLYVLGDIYTSDDKITINADDTAADSYLYFNSTENLKWDYSNTRFVFSDDVKADGYLEAGTDLYAGDNLYLNHNNTDANVVINFGLNPSGNETLTWNKTDTQFEFSDDLKVDGDLQVSGNDIKSSTGATAITLNGNSVEVAGDLTVGDDLAVNGNDITTSQTTFNLINTTATTLNIGGAATTVNIGAYSSTLSVNVPSLQIYSIATLRANTTSTSSTAQFTLDSTSRQTLKVMVSIVDTVTTETHSLEILAMKKGTTAYITTYGELYSSAALATFTADVSSGALRIRATPLSANSTTFNFVRTSLD